MPSVHSASSLLTIALAEQFSSATRSELPARLKLTPSLAQKLRCPVCRASLHPEGDQLRCTNCRALYPVVDGVPVLVNEAASLFSIQDLLAQRGARRNARRNLKHTLKHRLPALSRNIKSNEHLARFAQCLVEKTSHPIVLIVGGGENAGEGMETLRARPEIQLVESDVLFGPRTLVVSDAHDIPFDDESFDGVIIQAVLEHVHDPYRCVDEIHRVLNASGLVYAETPFMQQVHMGRYDFTRFTHLGHRRLFRKFEEIESGPVCGPGMALAWAYQYFLLSFVRSKLARSAVSAFARLTAFWLKYLDLFLINTPGGYDAASGYYFLGAKSQRTLSDRELIQLYKGGM